MESYGKQIWTFMIALLGAALLLLMLMTGAQAQTTDQNSLQAPPGELPEKPQTTGQEQAAPLPPQAPPQHAPAEPTDYAEVVVDTDPEGNPYVAGELLVSFKPDVSSQARDAAVRGAEAQTEEKLPELNARKLFFPGINNERAKEIRSRALEQKRQALERMPNVESAEYNYLAKPSFWPNDPKIGQQWGLKKINAPKAWNIAYGRGVRLAVLDTGFAAGHPELRNPIIYQRDFINNDNTAGLDPSYVASFDHGTHVAGTVAAATNNGRGVAGTSPGSDLFVAKVCKPYRFTENGKTYYEEGCPNWASIKALNFFGKYASHSNIKAVNISIGGFGYSSIYNNAVARAWNKGLVVVASAGNERTSRRSYPAAYPKAIAVSATKPSDAFAWSFSNYGNWVDVSAPGVGILSTVPGSAGFEAWNGTSMAAPHVTGLAGLLGSRDLNNAWIRYRIEATAADRGASGWDPRYGWGRINAKAAVNW